MAKNDEQLAKSENKALRQREEFSGKPTWSDIGDGFETMGKIGLAMAIGMSAAGLFCRLADQGKVRVPTLSSLMLSKAEQQEMRERDDS